MCLGGCNSVFRVFTRYLCGCRSVSRVFGALTTELLGDYIVARVYPLVFWVVTWVFCHVFGWLPGCFCVFTRAFLGVCIVARVFLWYSLVTWALLDVRVAQSVLWYSGLVTRALISVCIVAMVFLRYSGWLLGCC